MKKGKIIEKASRIIYYLAAVATIVATIYDFNSIEKPNRMFLSSIAALIFFISYGVHTNAKSKNKKDN